MPMKQRAQISQIVAANLQRHMERLGRTAGELALACDLSRSAIYDILGGRSSNPKLSTIDRIAGELGVPISQMFLTDEQISLYRQLEQDFYNLPGSEQARLAKLVRNWQID